MQTPFLRRCLTLAEQGRGKTGINPMVGAVLVREGKIIAEGFHSEYGLPHAERVLLSKCESGILPSDILYVNFEPCCHRNKKTPPCTDIIIERGIKTVVYGMKDPNPAVSGKGIEYLNKKGVQVYGPVLEQECKRLNRGFVSLMTKKRPWITLKKAQTVDGRTANDDGSFLKITSPEQDAWSHEFLRARHDAILVGVGTLLRDDPLLTVRNMPNPSPNPYPIILDPHLKIPLTAKVVRPSTIIITAPGSDAEKRKSLESAGVRIFEVLSSLGAGIPCPPKLQRRRGPAVGNHFDWHSLWNVLTTPTDDFYGISSILVEGGSRTWEMFRQARLVDEEVTLIG